MPEGNLAEGISHEITYYLRLSGSDSKYNVDIKSWALDKRVARPPGGGGGGGGRGRGGNLLPLPIELRRDTGELVDQGDRLTDVFKSSAGIETSAVYRVYGIQGFEVYLSLSDGFLSQFHIGGARFRTDIGGEINDSRFPIASYNHFFQFEIQAKGVGRNYELEISSPGFITESWFGDVIEN